MYCSGVLFAVMFFVVSLVYLVGMVLLTISFLIYIPLHPFIISIIMRARQCAVAAVLMPQAPKAEILSSESRVYNSILSVLQSCCLLNLFLQLAPALVVYQSPALIIAVRTDVTDGDGRTGVVTIVLTEFTTYFYFGVRRHSKFFNIESKSLYNPVFLIEIFNVSLPGSPGKMHIYCNIGIVNI